MTPVRETRYARIADDSYVAYQVVGDGPIDLVFTSGWFGHVEAQWDYPALARFLERLGSFSRLICFDRRGHGLSDPIDLDNITLEQWMDDVRIVMDAAGSERAAILGSGEGGPMSILFAATYPERTSALVLTNTSASLAQRPGYEWGMPPSVQEAVIAGIQASYWDKHSAAQFVGSITSSEQDQFELARLFRYATSPGMVRRLMRASIDVDVRDVLPAVRVPTLVTHRRDDRMRRVGG
ncbi:MAG: alpha/beta fold hydrolase, partial [Acidimicrobiales bacterium]